MPGAFDLWSLLGDPRPWPELGDARIAVLPVGSWEQHGESLPLYTDTLIAVAVAAEAARRLGAVILPPLAYGVSFEHRDFPLTVSIEPETLCGFLGDAAASLEEHGVRLLIVVNGHGGNAAALDACASRWNYRGGGLRIQTLLLWEAVRGWLNGEVHAGRVEASIVAYLTGRAGLRGRGEPGPCYPLRRTRECSRTGSLYPGEWEADPRLGERLLREMVEWVVGEARRAVEALGLQDPI